MNGQGEVGNQLGPGDEQQQGYHSDSELAKLFQVITESQKLWFLETYKTRLFRIQATPSIHPTVTSPLKLRQLKSRAGRTGRPATSAVKMMRMQAEA